MKTLAEVAEWHEGAEERLEWDLLARDPVCQLFFRWVDDLGLYRGKELACSTHGKDIALLFARPYPLALPLSAGEPRLSEQGEVEMFGAEKIASGMWALSPSLNMPGIIHAFVVLDGVPDPAPWERMIVWVGESGIVLG